MLRSKSFIVTGETVTRNHAHEKDIAKKVDAAINSFLDEVGGDYVDLKIDARVNPGVGMDVAFITIIVDIPSKKAEPSEPETKKKK